MTEKTVNLRESIRFLKSYGLKFTPKQERMLSNVFRQIKAKEDALRATSAKIFVKGFNDRQKGVLDKSQARRLIKEGSGLEAQANKLRAKRGLQPRKSMDWSLLSP